MCWGHAADASGCSARLGAEANDAIDEFLSLTLAHERRNTPSLEGISGLAGSAATPRSSATWNAAATKCG